MIDYASGFLRLPRVVIEAIGANPITLAVYIELLGRARWEGPVTRTTAHGVVELDVGQCCFGRGELAEAIGATEQRVRTALRHLETLSILTTESTKRGTVATLVGYKESVGQRGTTQPTQQPSFNQAPTTTKNEDPDPESSSFLADPEPRHGGGGDLVPGKAELYDPSAPIDSAAALEALKTLLHGGPRKGAIAVDREGPPTLQILQGGTP